jgi:hypothetical protein
MSASRGPAARSEPWPLPGRIKRHSLPKSGVQLASPITWALSPARSTTLSTRATAFLRLRRPQLSLPVRAGGCAPLLGPRLAVTQHRNVGIPAGHRTEGQCRSSAVAGRDAAHPVNGREGDILLARGAALPQRRVGVHAGECDGQVDPPASEQAAAGCTKGWIRWRSRAAGPPVDLERGGNEARSAPGQWQGEFYHLIDCRGTFRVYAIRDTA